MNSKNIRLLVIVGILAIVVFWGCGSYNGLVNAEEEVKAKWSVVEAKYQRRNDLIPNLVETVKGVTESEKGTFTEIAALRTGVLDAKKTLDNKDASIDEKVKAMGVMDAAQKALIKITVENYPNLKFPDNFKMLQDELAGTENRVGQARDDFSNAVKNYNTNVRRFPGVIFAKLFGFSTKEGFKADAGASEAPKIKMTK